jgi:dGTPase
MADQAPASAVQLPAVPAPPLAPWATDYRRSRGRLFAEAPSATRTEYQRDRDRIVHSTAFRRLAHKTQVFVPMAVDHFRTRLTHTIEVAQIARAIARSLGLDDDLAEALALAHDLGHTPFGHTGEDVLEVCMERWGGFDHNAQALRIVTRLESRYARYDGLNLTWEMLEGLVKHNGPLVDRRGAPLPRHAKKGVPADIVEHDARQSLELWSYASAEAQAAALADDIAYNTHDIDDALRAGLIDFEALRGVEFVGDLLREVEAQHPGLDRQRTIHEITRRLITRFVEDVIAESLGRLREHDCRSAAEVRGQSRPMVSFSPALESADKAIKGFLFPNVYRHPRIVVIRKNAADVVENLFGRFMQDPTLLPGGRAQAAAECGEADRARIVCDYIAGMTDRFALAEHRRLFGDAPDLR